MLVTGSEVIPDRELYKRGKQEAEKVYSSSFKNYSIIRYPKVFAISDLSTRILELMYLIHHQKSIPIKDLQKKMCFIHLRDASRFISWICSNKHLGTFNACSNGIETASSLIEKLNGDPEKLTLNKEQLSIF